MRLTFRLTDAEIDSALGEAGVRHLQQAQMRSLSGGELQRVLLARAIARKPQLLVLDEPVQGVDFAGEIALYELIKRVRNDLQCGVLLVSHDLHVVMAATDRVICLNGHVCCEGTPVTVASSEAFRELFGRHASSALAVYEHRHDHTHLPDGRVQHADGTISDNCHPGPSDEKNPEAGDSGDEQEHRHAG
jgi:zinc transport system ATP-binding protein